MWSQVADGVRRRWKAGERRGQFDALARRLPRAGAGPITASREKLDRIGRLLAGLGHKGVLARGYAIAHGPDGLVTSAGELKTGDAFEIEFADGRQGAVAAAGGKPAKKKAAKPKPGQGEFDL